MTLHAEPIVARAGRYYRVTRYIVVALFLVGGFMFLKDGFFQYPREEQDRKESIARGQPPLTKEHTEADIRLQKMLGLALPPLGLLFLVWTLHHSRGEYRLQDGILSVPGHPGIPADSITAVDRRLWDKKGVAYVHFQLPGQAQTRCTLDDFIYQREPTDAIFDKIEASLRGSQDETDS